MKFEEVGNVLTLSILAAIVSHMQIDAIKKNSNFEIFKSAIYMKSWSMPLIWRGTIELWVGLFWMQVKSKKGGTESETKVLSQCQCVLIDASCDLMEEECKLDVLIFMLFLGYFDPDMQTCVV